MTDAAAKTALIDLVADVVTAYVANNRVAISELPTLIAGVHAALASAGRPAEVVSVEPEPTRAVTVRKSLADPNRILSMIDGKPYASLKRHLAAHGLTADEYRARYSLAADYPMVAPGYAERRRDLAKEIGLGRKRPAASTKPGRKPHAAKATA